MTIKYLKFDNEAQALEQLASAYPNQDDGYVEQSKKHLIGNVGILYNDDAGTDPETLEVIAPATAKSGWHVNLLLIDSELPESLKTFTVQVDTPSAGFLGVTP